MPISRSAPICRFSAPWRDACAAASFETLDVKKIRRAPLWSRIWSSSRADNRGLATMAQAQPACREQQSCQRDTVFADDHHPVARSHSKRGKDSGDLADVPIQITIAPGGAVLDQRDLIRSFGNLAGRYLMDAVRQARLQSGRYRSLPEAPSPPTSHQRLPACAMRMSGQI